MRTITKVWNVDNTISLKAGGKVVFRTRICNLLSNDEQIKAYLSGWFGTDNENEWKLNQTQFRWSKKTTH